MSDGTCPGCGLRQAPENIVGYRLLPRPVVNIRRAGRNARALASRTWGSYRRFVRGKSLLPNEHEVHRVRLRSVGVFSVDHETVAAIRPLCIVTDKRVMAQDALGHRLQIGRENIARINIQREDASPVEPSYYLAIHRVGSDVHEIQGDVALYCLNRQDCYRLAESLQLDR